MFEHFSADSTTKGEEAAKDVVMQENEGRILQSTFCDEDDFLHAINATKLPYCYSCHVAPPAKRTVVRVAYDYELTWNRSPGEDFAQTALPLLESGLVVEVASELHVRSCEPDRQNFANFTIVGVSSLYIDFRDIDVGSCEYLESNDTVGCAPVKGSMSAEFIGEDPTGSAVENVLLSVIADVMDSKKGLSGPIRDVSFIGDRATYSGSNRVANVAADRTSSTDDDLRIRNTTLASCASALFLIIVVIGAAILVRRNSESNKKSGSPASVPVEVETCDEDNNESQPAQRNIISRDLEIPSSPPRKEKDSDQSDALSSGADEADDSASTTAIADLPEELAPGPPQSHSEQDSVQNSKDAKSETLKKRRKKKKKKFNKKVTLVRVNSRENVASMETISEYDEAEQQDNLDDEVKASAVPTATYSTSDDDEDDDEGSEYSTASSDNEQDSEREAERPSSRSPARRRNNLPPLPPVEF